MHDGMTDAVLDPVTDPRGDGGMDAAPASGNATLDAMAPHAPMAAPPEPPAQPREFPLRFTGDGEEYFRIWIVNLLLTLATVGIYSPWAKVRRLQYFHRNTHLDGSVFDYHGRPLAILKGRVAALLLVGAYNLAAKVSATLAVAAALVMVAVLPWLLVQSLRFRAHNTSYRGLRFGFAGTVRDGYLAYALPLAALVVPFAVMGSVTISTRDGASARVIAGGILLAVAVVLVPLFHHRLARFHHDHMRLGQADGRLAATAGSFYGTYLRVAGIAALLMGGIGAAVGAAVTTTDRVGDAGTPAIIGVAIALGLLFYLGTLTLVPVLRARLQNLVWNRFTLGPVTFRSALPPWRLAWVMASNVVLTVVTLGLYAPFAAVRLYRARVESMAVVAAESPTLMASEVGAPAGATGEGVADLLDLDFAL